MCCVSGLSYNMMMNRNMPKRREVKKNEPFIRASGTLHLRYNIIRNCTRGEQVDDSRKYRMTYFCAIFDW